MRIVHRIIEMHAARPAGAEEIVGLVPTMGGLHAGHEALFRAARPDCDLLVASLFVNPPQFTQAADLDAYPRDLSATRRSPRPPASTCCSPRRRRDVPAGLRHLGRPGGAATGLEESSRPGHSAAWRRSV